MTALYILGVIAALIALLCLIPVGAEIRYDEAGFALAVRAGSVSVRIGGRGQEKEKKPKKQKPEKPREPKPEKPRKKGGLPPFPVLKMLAEHGFRTLGRIVSRLHVDVLKIHFVSAFDDPAAAAMAYGTAGTAMEVLLSLGGGRIRRADLRADVDFDSSTPRLDFMLRLTIRIGGLLGAALRFGFGFLRDYLPYRRQERKEQHGW